MRPSFRTSLPGNSGESCRISPWQRPQIFFPVLSIKSEFPRRNFDKIGVACEASPRSFKSSRVISPAPNPTPSNFPLLNSIEGIFLDFRKGSLREEKSLVGNRLKKSRPPRGRSSGGPRLAGTASDGVIDRQRPPETMTKNTMGYCCSRPISCSYLHFSKQSPPPAGHFPRCRYSRERCRAPPLPPENHSSFTNSLSLLLRRHATRTGGGGTRRRRNFAPVADIRMLL